MIKKFICFLLGHKNITREIEKETENSITWILGKAKWCLRCGKKLDDA